MRKDWELEEAVALFDLYFKNGEKVSAPKNEVENISAILRKRASILGYHVDSKFRNVAGIKRQLACIHSVVTNGAEGLSHVSKLFEDTYRLYREDQQLFNSILSDFYNKYHL